MAEFNKQLEIQLLLLGFKKGALSYYREEDHRYISILGTGTYYCRCIPKEIYPMNTRDISKVLEWVTNSE